MQNKIYFKIVSVLFLAVTLIGCKKWVEYNPHDDYLVTDLDYLKSENDYKTMAVSVYTPLQWLNQTLQIGDIASDNSVAGGESASDVLSLQQIDDMSHTPVNTTLDEIWKACYEGINRANYLHQFKNANPAGVTVDFAGKESMYGEIYFLRAYYYFNLVRLFGDVPRVVVEPVAQDDGRGDARVIDQAVMQIAAQAR